MPSSLQRTWPVAVALGHFMLRGAAHVAAVYAAKSLVQMLSHLLGPTAATLTTSLHVLSRQGGPWLRDEGALHHTRSPSPHRRLSRTMLIPRHDMPCMMWARCSEY